MKAPGTNSTKITHMHKALFYKNLKNGEVQCTLCPHKCMIYDGETGKCYMRKNVQGSLYNSGYGSISAMALDPVEKKPLYHFYPGAEILSIGGFGCNLVCRFCQNYHISQTTIDTIQSAKKTSPEEIIETAIRLKPKAGIAFTYNEPIINFEFVAETFKLAKTHHIPTVLISNGFINPEPLKELIKITDAFNIDLKGFNDEFYEGFTKGKLNPVLETIKTIAEANKHLEITHLLVTEANDYSDIFTNMCQWIADNAGKLTPLHVSRYFPNFQHLAHATETQLLDDFLNIAAQYLDFVYGGNYKDRTHTICPQCGTKIIDRNGYKVKTIGIDGKNCLNCHIELPIIL